MLAFFLEQSRVDEFQMLIQKVRELEKLSALEIAKIPKYPAVRFQEEG